MRDVIDRRHLAAPGATADLARGELGARRLDALQLEVPGATQ
jgi:hypothetical protein